jgi:hypothetical protein
MGSYKAKKSLIAIYFALMLAQSVEIVGGILGLSRRCIAGVSNNLYYYKPTAGEGQYIIRDYSA